MCKKLFFLTTMLSLLLVSQVFSQSGCHDFTLGHLEINSGYLDLYSNTSWGIVTHDPYEKIWDYIASGYDDGTWEGSGIISSWAKNHPEENCTLGIISGEDYLTWNSGVFENHTVQEGDVLIKYTPYGDSNLDGRVDEIDAYILQVAQENRAAGHYVPNNWVNGNYSYQVPEPATWLMLLMGGVSIFVVKMRKKIAK
jgi:hypothetical protein